MLTTMDYQKTMQALKRLRVETGSLACFGCGNEHNCSTQGCAILRNAVAHMEAALDRATLTPPNEWVSVEERLPEPTYCVLVYTTDFSIEVDAIGSDGEWMSYEVTHWMPLSVPPDLRPPEGEANA